MNKIILDNYPINYQVFFKNIKHMYLRIENGQIVVTCNKKTKKKTIEAFINNKKSWILSRLTVEPIFLYSKKSMFFLGEKFSVIINEKQKKYICFENNKFIINKNTIDKKLIEKFYINLTIIKAKEILNKNSFNYFEANNLIIKSQLMKSRLGSCNRRKKIIKLNSILTRFDLKYLEMVLYHELAHLKINNHSHLFYQELISIYPNYQKNHKQLNNLIKNIHY